MFGLSLAADDVSNMFHLGRRSTDSTQRKDHPRPLLITLKDNLKKRRIMSDVGKLKDASDRFAAVGISNDLTPKQREENRHLLEDAKQRLLSDNKDPKNFKFLIVTRENQRIVITKPVRQ